MKTSLYTIVEKFNIPNVGWSIHIEGKIVEHKNDEVIFYPTDDKIHPFLIPNSHIASNDDKWYKFSCLASPFITPVWVEHSADAYVTLYGGSTFTRISEGVAFYKTIEQAKTHAIQFYTNLLIESAKKIDSLTNIIDQINNI